MPFINKLKTSLDNFRQQEHPLLALGAAALVILIPLLIILFRLSFSESANQEQPETDFQITTSIYDPISNTTYIEDTQSDEFPDESNIQFLGFTPIINFLTNEAYSNLVTKITSYAEKTYPSTRYVSLYSNSIEKQNDNSYTFTIYFDSENPTNVTLTLNPFSIKFSPQNN